MKLGIITHYDVHNHGALLQLHSLKTVLKSLGHEAIALRFKHNYDFLDGDAEHKYNITLKSIPFYIGYLLKKGLPITYFNYRKKKILDNFKAERELVGDYYSHSKDIDAIFIGSDEVFSIECGIVPILWGFGSTTKNIYSYAASFGPTTLEWIKQKNATEFIRGGISNISKISVRDENSRKIIENLSNKQVEMVCDPVILYGYEKEIKEFTKPENYKYILIYSYDNNMNKEEEIKKIKEFADKRNLKIISVGFYHKWCDKSINVSPIELIRYINGAELVITDTFHGSVISIITNSEFITKIRGNGNKLRFLLKQHGLEHRITENFENIEEIVNTKINYDNVNKIIKNEREESIKFLKSCLENNVNE